MLLKYLETHDAACPLCKYNLRNLTVPRCPECGKEIKLMVGLVEQNIAPFVCFTMALVLPAGLGFIGWVAVFREGLGNYQFHSLSRTLESLSLIGFQLAFFTLIIPLLIRRKFLRMQLRNQWICAALAAIEPLVLFGMLLASIMLLP